MMNIDRGSKVKCKVTGLEGVVENVAEYLHGMPMCCVQPSVGSDGRLPESVMIDWHQLKLIERNFVTPTPPTKKTLRLGQIVKDPISGNKCGVIGVSVYLNGCRRVLLEPIGAGEKRDSYWMSQDSVVAVTDFFGKLKFIRGLEGKNKKYSTGGPAEKSSKL